MGDILRLISNNIDLLQLYHTDTTFRKSIEVAIEYEMDNENALIFALIQGYKAKQIVNDDYINYIKSDCRPVILKGDK